MNLSFIFWGMMNEKYGHERISDISFKFLEPLRNVFHIISCYILFLMQFGQTNWNGKDAMTKARVI